MGRKIIEIIIREDEEGNGTIKKTGEFLDLIRIIAMAMEKDEEMHSVVENANSIFHDSVKELEKSIKKRKIN